MNEEKQIGITVKKEDDFSEWFTQIITKADLADYTKVSGCMVLKPYGYAIWEKLKEAVDKRLKVRGVKNVYFPLFIPESLLKKEQVHVKGFSPEVAWVTHTGKSKLSERLAVRPTSEAIMYDSYSKWIRSWKDLPLKLNQWNSVVRWEFKHPVPFLRTREFLWNEGHTVFATRKEAEEEVVDILNMYDEVLQKEMALYGLKGKKSEKEKFAGAEYTLTIELLLPNGKAIQGPDSHYDGQNFAKAYDITFLDQNKEKQYVYQNTWAITTRMIGVMIAIHSDDKGLIVPPKLAPNKIVIIPIIFKKDKDKVIKKANEVFKKLGHYDPILDIREYSAGWKFNEWEMKGIPIRIEIGPQDVKKKQITLVRRDNNKKLTLKLTQLKQIDKILDDIQDNLFKKAKKILNDNIKEVKTFEEFKKAIKDKKIVKAPWCNTTKCEDIIKYKTEGVKSLNIPLKDKKPKGLCVYCKKPAITYAYFGKSY